MSFSWNVIFIWLQTPRKQPRPHTGIPFWQGHWSLHHPIAIYLTISIPLSNTGPGNSASVSECSSAMALWAAEIRRSCTFPAFPSWAHSPLLPSIDLYVSIYLLCLGSCHDPSVCKAFSMLRTDVTTLIFAVWMPRGAVSAFVPMPSDPWKGCSGASGCCMFVYAGITTVRTVAQPDWSPAWNWRFPGETGLLQGPHE